MKAILLIILALAASILIGVGIAKADSADCWWNWQHGDMNCDGRLTMLDFSQFATYYNQYRYAGLPPQPTPTPAPGLKGIAWTGCTGDCAVVTSDYELYLRALGADAFLTWNFGAEPVWTAARATGARFIPMQWCTPVEQATIDRYVAANGTGNTYLMFNEPNVEGQCDRTPAQAVPLFMEGSARILARDPQARFVVGGVLTALPGWQAWLDGFWATLPAEGRARVYGWHAHNYTGGQSRDQWQTTVRQFVDWCRAHGGHECWDTEGPALLVPGPATDAWYRMFMLGGMGEWGSCGGRTCYDWWQSQVDATFWWSAHAYGNLGGNLVNRDGTLTLVGRMFDR